MSTIASCGFWNCGSCRQETTPTAEVDEALRAKMVVPKFTHSFFEEESLLLKKLQNFLKRPGKDKFSILTLQKSETKIGIPLAALGYSWILKEEKENLARYLKECWCSIENGPLSLLNIYIALYNYIETRKVELEGIRLQDHLMNPSIAKAESIFKILFEGSEKKVIDEGAKIVQRIMQAPQFVKIYTNSNEEYDEVLNDNQLKLVRAKLRLYIVDKMKTSKNHFDIEQLRKEFDFVPTGPNPDTESAEKASSSNADQNRRHHDLENRKETIRILEQRLSLWKSKLGYQTNSSIEDNAPEQMNVKQETVMKIQNVVTDASSEKSFPRADVMTTFNDEKNKNRKITSSNHEDTTPSKTNGKNISEYQTNSSIEDNAPEQMNVKQETVMKIQNVVTDASSEKSFPRADVMMTFNDEENKKRKITSSNHEDTTPSKTNGKNISEYKTNSSMEDNASEQMNVRQETIQKMQNVVSDASNEKSFSRADVMTTFNDEENKKRKMTSSDHEDMTPCKTNGKNISDEVDSATSPGSMHSNSPKLPRKKRLVFDLTENKYELIAIP